MIFVSLIYVFMHIFIILKLDYDATIARIIILFQFNNSSLYVHVF